MNISLTEEERKTLAHLLFYIEKDAVYDSLQYDTDEGKERSIEVIGRIYDKLYIRSPL